MCRHVPSVWLVPLFLGFLSQLFFSSGTAQEPASIPVVRIELALPIVGNADDRLIQQLEVIAKRPIEGNRPIVILEFVRWQGSKDEKATVDKEAPMGLGTNFERALRIARWLSSPEGNRLRSIAYVKEALAGHAILIALGCEEIAIEPGATISNASANERQLDGMVRQAYQDTRAKRELIPEAVVAAWLEPSAEVHRVDLVDGGELFVGRERLEELRTQGKFWGEEQLSLPGRPVQFSGSQMRKWRWVGYTVSDPQDLANELGLATLPRIGVTDGDQWRPVVLQLHGNVSRRQVNRLIRALDESVTVHQSNLLLLDINSAGGSLDSSLILAHYLANCSPESLETVAYISGIASGDAAIIAMSCRNLYMAPYARLGGVGEATIQPSDIGNLAKSWTALASQLGRTPGEFYGPVCPDLETFRYSNARGQVRWDSVDLVPVDEENPWVKGDKLVVGDGLMPDALLKLRWIQGTHPTFEAVGLHYGIQEMPEPKRTNRVEALVQRLAEIPFLPGLLLLLGVTALMVELTHPGAMLPGLFATGCFALFVWIRMLEGTVEWLEVILFVGGVLLVLIELFIIPGFGVVGITGLLMLVIAVVLASQTFVFPSNRYQMNAMAWNMGQVAAILCGLALGLYLVRDQLEELPFFRWLRLSPVDEHLAAAIEANEHVVHYEYLQGKAGVTVTRCNPSGKVRVGADVVNVVSTGDLLAEETPVRVVEVRGNTIVVEAIE